METKLKHALDWGRLAPLRLRSRSVADGVYAGAHRSLRRGSGVEFGGHRAYVPGDDLRWLDRHASMRHDRLLVREFETETDRALRLLVDASRSMAFRSTAAPGAKLAYAALLAAALARVAVSSGDPVALDWLGGQKATALAGSSGREAFDRITGALESAVAAGDLSTHAAAVEHTLARVAQHSGRGAGVVFLSDLLDLPAVALDRLAGLAVRGRIVVVVRVLDPVELTFPFEGPVRLAASDGQLEVETDPRISRSGYLAALEDTARRWHARLLERGGGLVRASTADDPVAIVRAVLDTAAARRT